MKIYLETTFMEKQLYQPIINRYPQFEFTFNKDEDCEILIGVFFDRDEIYFDHFKNLKWIMLFVAGFDHLDLAYLKKRQIMLTNGQTVYDIQIAEDVVAKMLFLNRQMGIYHDQMKTHVWKHQAPHYELYQQQVLILGAGSIGQLIAKRLKAFEMEIIGYKRTYENLDNFDAIITKKDELIKYYRSCDYLIVCLPLTKQTKNFIDKKVFDLLKPTALLINIARGDIIDQDALIDALNQNKIRGAALDVTSPEPLPKNHPLWDANHVFITPHNASASPMMQQRRLDLICDQLDLFLTDKKIQFIITRGQL